MGTSRQTCHKQSASSEYDVLTGCLSMMSHVLTGCADNNLGNISFPRLLLDVRLSSERNNCTQGTNIAILASHIHITLNFGVTHS